MTDGLTEFIAEFHPKLGSTNRWAAFSTIANVLLGHNRAVVIIETGTARTAENWAGDGQSTLVWDYLSAVTGGFGYSVDSDIGACAVARRQVRATRVVCDDSIHFLGSIQLFARSADLLYLDSFDWSHHRQAESCLHHAGELATVWNELPSGCLIAVDDCLSPTEGKHLLVREFFRLQGIAPLVESYVHVWRKP